MNLFSKSLASVFQSGVIESLKNYEKSNDDNFLGDLYIYYNKDSQTLTFFDDIEKELLEIRLAEKNIAWKDDDSRDEIEFTAKEVLKKLEKENFFDKKFIHKPFSVSLVDSDFIVMEELIYLDDETLKIDADLWSNLDKELDSFLKELMK